jgi:putative transposase
LALTPYRHYTVDEKQELLALIARAERVNPGCRRTDILKDLGVGHSTFYRWLERANDGTLCDAQVLPDHLRLPPTPDEIARVVEYAQVHPLLGYKRLTWAMVDKNVACLRAWMVHAILQEHHLLGRRARLLLPYARPDEPDHPDQRWHTDLMSLKLNGRWFYLIDVLDAYSRYLVYWEVLLSARADVVVLAAQRALETLNGRKQIGAPEIVHDRGPQFVGHEWRVFVRNAEVGDIPTRAHHPQSNGRVERLHRTTKEEGLNEQDREDLFRARDALTRWQHYYNDERPHTALQYLHPVDYYRGDPSARLAEREEKLRCAADVRAAYWRMQSS